MNFGKPLSQCESRPVVLAKNILAFLFFENKTPRAVRPHRANETKGTRAKGRESAQDHRTGTPARIGVARIIPADVELAVVAVHVHAATIDAAGAGTSPADRIKPDLVLPVDLEQENDRFAAGHNLLLHLPQPAVAHSHELRAGLGGFQSSRSPENLLCGLAGIKVDVDGPEVLRCPPPVRHLGHEREDLLAGQIATDGPVVARGNFPGQPPGAVLTLQAGKVPEELAGVLQVESQLGARNPASTVGAEQSAGSIPAVVDDLENIGDLTGKPRPSFHHTDHIFPEPFDSDLLIAAHDQLLSARYTRAWLCRSCVRRAPPKRGKLSSVVEELVIYIPHYKYLVKILTQSQKPSILWRLAKSLSNRVVKFDLR
ncbi:MAG: hypothetical protein COU10_00095 [Candidatus Harrisonbacteria bacterium CG10_big_fil_rev_8_21_14_0_10_45_28]|uniref:Uncharacterized protein n=1 Tax=Candidatus Harrisonbacteria bacterium CG10_big_fil_rev_8_21_14_0_10_45_28 TaxID=1974586 RepID=A0A2H0UPD4_9BACT|nr:MAG: hypothetical protein COU10_00095 [Candidatus Harrisonbacteria bacterium CG10_big_fil_rev_8_21_14_0_10_45_28]